MYNRYVPQSDGSFRRQRCQESAHHPKPEHPSHPKPTETPQVDCPPPIVPPPPCPVAHKTRQEPCRSTNDSIKGFFQNLLPKDFDTSDLLIILLLLLMSGDNAEDQNTALLTLALYCFM